MSSENDDRHFPDQVDEGNYGSFGKSIITYTRDFLLSLSKSDACKSLPNGFDQSILSEYGEASLDRPRFSGGLSLQSFRRNEYGSSPPTKGDSSNFSRGIHGKWDNRASGRSDRDSESQSDMDSDSGWRYDNQSRRSRQVPEHDGLLGSGSFPRASGYTGVALAPKLRVNDHSQLNKTKEPYQPPRPYKAIPPSRREVNDSFNNETFGSSDSTSEDRAEEERKRRESFELMRKEQQKEFQNRVQLNVRKQDDFDILSLSEDPIDKTHPYRRNEYDDTVITKASITDAEKLSFSSQTLAVRPLVPPGFSSTVLERNVGAKSSVHSAPTEVGNSELAGSLLGKQSSLLTGISDNQDEKPISVGEQHRETKIFHVSTNESGENLDFLPAVGVSGKAAAVSQLYQTSDLSKTFEVSENAEVKELDACKVMVSKGASGLNQGRSGSMLEKLFSSSLPINHSGSSSLIEHHDSNTIGALSPQTLQSSKFADWFSEEEDNKLVNDISSSTPGDSLSLVVGGEKGETQASEVKVTKQILPDLPFPNTELCGRHLTSNLTSATVGDSSQLYDISRPKAVPTILTCEDLEQSILSAVSEQGSTLLPLVPDRNTPDVWTERTKVDNKDPASHHLLSLLQKGSSLNNAAPLHNLDIMSSHKPRGMGAGSIGSVLENSEKSNNENAFSAGSPLILGTLFGTEFMKELQSVGAPVSSQRGPDETPRVDDSDGICFPLINDCPTAEIRSNRTSHDYSAVVSKQRRETKSNKSEESGISVGDPQREVVLSLLQTELGPKSREFYRPVEIQLPEEDSMLSVNDPVYQKLMHDQHPAKHDLLSFHAASITERRGALNSVFKEVRPIIGGREDLPQFLGPYDSRESNISRHNPHSRPSFPQIHPSHLNHMEPLFRPQDSYPANSRIKMIPSEGFTHHHDSPNLQFPTNMLPTSSHRPSAAGLSGFDSPAHHVLQQKMHMGGNFIPPQLIQGLPRGVCIPPHVNNQGTCFMNKASPAQVPFARQQPNFNSIGIPPAPAAGGGNHPEASLRLIGMEPTPSSQQIHPLAAAGHNRGMFGHELNTGFGYR